MTYATPQATFTGAEDSVAVTWTPLGVAYAISGISIIITDGGGPPQIWLTSPSDGAATVNTTARFSGTVTLTVEPLS